MCVHTDHAQDMQSSAEGRIHQVTFILNKTWQFALPLGTQLGGCAEIPEGEQYYSFRKNNKWLDPQFQQKLFAFLSYYFPEF